MNDNEQNKELSMLLLNDEFNTGRYFMYMALVEYLNSIMKGEKNPSLIDKLKAITHLRELVKEVQEENLNKDEIAKLKATECLELREIEKDAYIENLKSFYSKHGYKIDVNLPVDHIIVQLAFLARLIKDTTKESEKEKIELIKTQSRFIKTHLLNWMENCAQKHKILLLIKQILEEDWEILFEFLKNMTKNEETKKKNR